MLMTQFEPRAYVLAFAITADGEYIEFQILSNFRSLSDDYRAAIGVPSTRENGKLGSTEFEDLVKYLEDKNTTIDRFFIPYGHGKKCIDVELPIPHMDKLQELFESCAEHNNVFEKIAEKALAILS